MKPRSVIILWAALVALTGLAAGCSTTPTMDTRAVEERYFGVGYARHMYDYGESLLEEGRYREAMQAFNAAESSAYTYGLRRAARARRMWLEQAIAAYERGEKPPPLPKIDLGNEEAAEAKPAAPAPAAAATPAPPAASKWPRLVPLTPAPPPVKGTAAAAPKTNAQALTPLTPSAGRKARGLTESATDGSSLAPAPK